MNIIDPIVQITRIRARNNGAWMALLELALECRPKEARAILQQILDNDRAVSAEIERLIGK